MTNDRTRRPVNARDKAELLFKAAAPKPVAPVAKRPAVPVVKEMVSLRIDSDVLAHFQDDGPGWQDRINDFLRRAVPAPSDEGLSPEKLNSSNDG